MNNKANSQDSIALSRALGRFTFLFVGSALAVLSLVIFHDFIFGDSVLLYKDIGSDSINIFYPNYVLRSDYLRQVGLFSWSFQAGMGQNLSAYVGTLLIGPLVWLPKSLIAHAIVYQHLLYILIAGLCFWKLLTLRNLSKTASLLGAISLAFSSYMSMGSCWYFHAQEVAGFAFLMLSAELAVSRARWVLIAPAVALLGFLGAFHLYLAALFLCFFVPFRLFERYGWQSNTAFGICVSLAGAAVLGVGLGAIVTLDGLSAMLNSPRGSTRIGHAWPTPEHMFQAGSSTYYLTAALRFFSNDILGTGNDFRGAGNYLEAPIFYAGLISLLIFPQVFVRARPIHRILYATFVCLVILPIAFPWFRFLFWLFHGGYFRTFSLFSILGILTLSMSAFSHYLEKGILNRPLLVLTLLASLAILYFPSGAMQALVDPNIRNWVAIFLVLYAGLLILGQLLKRQAMAGRLILGLVAIELVCFDRITISSRPTVTKTELRERVGYNDVTTDALRDIKSDDRSFYRVTKTWSSGPSMHPSLNDAMVFGYYGTSSYSSFNNLNYINFLMAVDAISGADLPAKIQWSRGLEGHRLLSAFACEKYVLTKNPVPFETAGYYELVRKYGTDAYLLRNHLFLPLGLSFDRYITDNTLSQVPAQAKALAVLHAIVVPDQQTGDQAGLTLLSMDELRSKVRDIVPADIIAERRETSLQMRSFSETRIKGTIKCNESRVLVIQTPFDRGWLARVNGRESTTLKVDGGLLGVLLSKGEHSIDIRYRPPFFYHGATITLLSCCLFGWCAWKWPRVRLPLNPA